MMKQRTKQKIETFERAFRQGKQVMWFDRVEGRLRFCTWIPVTDITQIKELVLKEKEIKVL
ncbi:MAG: hypothetical protein IKS48_00280 [Eubacterium sp.]|nr:hypothetical protein [Eubacterium sp.]